MKLIRADKPINQSDEICEEQIEWGHEERLFGKLRMQIDGNHFRNERGHTEEVTDPDAWKWGQRPRLRLLFLLIFAGLIHPAPKESALGA